MINGSMVEIEIQDRRNLPSWQQGGADPQDWI